MNALFAFLSDSGNLLYVRGFVYLYIAVMLFFSSMVYVNPDARLWSWSYRARMLTLAIYFFILSMGGISAYVGFPELGRMAITYGATLAAVVYAVLITMFVLFRK